MNLKTTLPHAPDRGGHVPFVVAIGVAVLIGTMGLAGCTVGPDFHPPTAPEQTRYLASGALTETGSAPGAADGAAQHFEHGARLQRDWYRLYHSAALDKLIARALAANPTRAAAQQRLAAAREAVNVVYGGRYPGVQAGASAERSRQTGVMLGVTDPDFANTFNLFKGGLSATYNLDIFGELTRRIEDKQALAAVAHDKLLDSQATLVNNVVATALAEAGARTTLKALQAIVTRQRKAVKLVEAQERLGTALQSDVLRAQTQLANTEALLPDFKQQIAVARHRMAILTGQAPADYHGPKFTLDDFSLPGKLPLTLPSRLVVQRPDVLAARDLLHAASARVGIATAEELPRLQLTAGYSRSALKLNGFNGPLAEMFSVGAGLTAPLFEGGTLRARKRQTVANLHAAASDYQAVVLKAFDQVADALRALDNDVERLAARNRARQAAQSAARLTQAQYRAGSADLLSAYLSQVQLTRAEINYAKARLARLVDTATLVRALGGGWWPAAANDVASSGSPATSDAPPSEPPSTASSTRVSTRASSHE